MIGDFARLPHLHKAVRSRVLVVCVQVVSPRSPGRVFSVLKLRCSAVFLLLLSPPAAAVPWVSHHGQQHTFSVTPSFTNVTLPRFQLCIVFKCPKTRSLKEIVLSAVLPELS